MFTFAEGSLDHPSSIDDEGEKPQCPRALCGGVAGTGRAQLLAFLLTSEMGRVSIRMTTVEGGMKNIGSIPHLHSCLLCRLGLRIKVE